MCYHWLPGVKAPLSALTLHLAKTALSSAQMPRVINQTERVNCVVLLSRM